MKHPAVAHRQTYFAYTLHEIKLSDHASFSSLTEELMAKPEVSGVRFLFLVGGFAESPMLQKAVQRALGRTCRIIIPHDVGLTILKGAVLFGLDPTVVSA